MTKLRRPLAVLVTTLTVGACAESATAPALELPEARRDIGVAVFDPTLVAFNSASCTLNSTATGAVSCSWDIGNPAENLMNLSAEVFLDVSYDCVNPKNGRVHSSEVKQERTFRQYSGVFSASLTGTNETLPLVALINDYVRSMKKQNACKGNNVPESLSWSLAYWDISVVTLTAPLRTSCFASDNRNGCLTGFGI